MSNDSDGLPRTAEEVERLAAASMGDSSADVIVDYLGLATTLRQIDRTVTTMRIFKHLAVDFGRQVAEAMAVAEQGLRRMHRNLDPTLDLTFRRIEHAGMAEDARRWPDQWFSYHCAAFLCESCPSDREGLRCNCPHHRKDAP